MRELREYLDYAVREASDEPYRVFHALSRQKQDLVDISSTELPTIRIHSQGDASFALTPNKYDTWALDPESLERLCQYALDQEIRDEANALSKVFKDLIDEFGERLEIHVLKHYTYAERDRGAVILRIHNTGGEEPRLTGYMATLANYRDFPATIDKHSVACWRYRKVDVKCDEYVAKVLAEILAPRKVKS